MSASKKVRTAVEVGYPSEIEPLMIPYCDGSSAIFDSAPTMYVITTSDERRSPYSASQVGVPLPPAQIQDLADLDSLTVCVKLLDQLV